MFSSFFHFFAKKSPQLLLSPWLDQLKRVRPAQRIEQDMQTEVVIVGAGISGISTAYFTLKHTNKKIILLEAGKVAHGATGHNAGQIVSYFERQVSDLVKEFGIEMTAKAQSSVDSAWGLIEDMCQEAKLQTPLYKFTGYAGCQDIEEVLVHLENSVYCKEAGIAFEPMIIADLPQVLDLIPPKYEGLYSVLSHSEMLAVLNSKDAQYIAVVCAKKGCMNSAVFCEELLEYMLKSYADRLTVFEHSPMHELILQKNRALVHVKDHIISCENVVLCTNGYEKFTIHNTAGKDIDGKFHTLVLGLVGYMAGYVEKLKRAPTAISYLPKRSKTGNTTYDSDPYFYLTRRPFGENSQHTLTCIGGPESISDDANQYVPTHPYPQEAQEAINTFLHKTYTYAPKGKIRYHYLWHGLIGYTPNGVRCIGREPFNPVLLYNLGCNGIGLLPSIYGGKKISRLLKGEKPQPSIFDPKESYA